MNPNGRILPVGRLQRCVPRRGHGAAIEVQGRDGGADCWVSLCQRHTAPIWAGSWPIGGVDPLQGGHELRQNGRRLAKMPDALDSRVLAFQPGGDGSVPRIPLSRTPLGQRERDGQREVGSQLR
jgi:hypothetical protein